MPLRNDLLNPIPGDNPSGANLRFEPITDKIKEARREELDVPQGQWKTTVKTADLPAVIKLAGDVLANRSKDLQIAVWLVDAHIRREGFPIAAPCFQFLRDLLEQFWDTLYPAIEEEGDLEVRAAQLAWLGVNLSKPDSPSSLGFLPIVAGKLSWAKYQESRKVGYEKDADNYEKQQAREAAITEGKLTSEQFDEAAENTSLPALKETYRLINEGLEALESLSSYCDEKFAELGDEAPSFVRTRETIEEIAQTVRIILSRRPGGLDEPPAEEEAVEEPAAEEYSYSTDSSSLEEPVSVDDSGDEDQENLRSSLKSGAAFGEPESREDVGRHLVSLCRFLRAQDPSDPTPYLLLRGFAWGGMMANAPMIDHSALEAPPSELRVGLKRLLKENEWDKALEATEEALTQPYGRTWIDMQRYVENALSGKGLGSVATVVNKSLRLTLEMLPDLLELTLPDDTPAANQETKTWIENFVILRGMPPPQPKAEGEGESGESSDPYGSSDTPTDSFSFDETPADTSFDTPAEEPAAEEPTPEPEPEPEPEPPPPEPEPYEVEDNPPIMEPEEPPPSDSSDEFVQALAAVNDGRTADGLAIITALLATESNGRARFRRRTQLAHLLMAAGKIKVAHPMLDQLCGEIEERKLEDWEQSEAIAYPLELLLHCLSPAEEEKRTNLYTRICKLDPVRAVNCSF